MYLSVVKTLLLFILTEFVKITSLHVSDTFLVIAKNSKFIAPILCTSQYLVAVVLPLAKGAKQLCSHR